MNSSGDRTSRGHASVDRGASQLRHSSQYSRTHVLLPRAVNMEQTAFAIESVKGAADHVAMVRVR